MEDRVATYYADANVAQLLTSWLRASMNECHALCVLFAFCFYRNFYDPNFNLQLAAQRRRVCSMIRFSAMSNNLPESQQPPQKIGAVTQAADPSPVTSESNAEFPELRNACVLLVDDSDVVRDVSRAVLEDAGVVVEEAADGDRKSVV